MMDDYKKFTALDFAQDDSFIQWVKNSDPEASTFWEKWQLENPEKTQAIQEARQLVNTIHFKETPPSTNQVDRIWGEISKNIQPENAESPSQKLKAIHQKTNTRRSIFRWLPYAAAASIALLLFVFNPFSSSSQELISKQGEQKTYYLPDSSIVKLNAESKIVFNKKNWTNNRIIQLEGEAFFEVKKGNRFVVETPNGSVEVLGTSFNVNARSSNLTVDCFTGKVKVSAPTQPKATILTPLEGVKLTKATQNWQTYPVDPQRNASWRTGMFYFSDIALTEVFEELERQFDIQIQVDKKQGDRKYTGFFNKSDVELALKSICTPMGLNFDKQGKVIRIHSN